MNNQIATGWLWVYKSWILCSHYIVILNIWTFLEGKVVISPLLWICLWNRWVDMIWSSVFELIMIFFGSFARKLTKSYFNNGLFCQVYSLFQIKHPGQKAHCVWMRVKFTDKISSYMHTQYFMPNYEALGVIHTDISWFGSFVMKVSFVFILIYIAFNRLYINIYISSMAGPPAACRSHINPNIVWIAKK